MLLAAIVIFHFFAVCGPVNIPNAAAHDLKQHLQSHKVIDCLFDAIQKTQFQFASSGFFLGL